MQKMQEVNRRKLRFIHWHRVPPPCAMEKWQGGPRGVTGHNLIPVFDTWRDESKLIILFIKKRFVCCITQVFYSP